MSSVGRVQVQHSWLSAIVDDQNRSAVTMCDHAISDPPEFFCDAPRKPCSVAKCVRQIRRGTLVQTYLTTRVEEPRLTEELDNERPWLHRCDRKKVRRK